MPSQSDGFLMPPAVHIQTYDEEKRILFARRDGRGAPGGLRMHDAMGHHAMVQGADGVASPGAAEPWKETVHETGKCANQHAAAEPEGLAHVLEVGLIDRGGMIGEAAKHLTILGADAGNGLLTLRHSRLI